jgi:hypothetical protein
MVPLEGDYHYCYNQEGEVMDLPEKIQLVTNAQKVLASYKLYLESAYVTYDKDVEKAWLHEEFAAKELARVLIILGQIK